MPIQQCLFPCLEWTFLCRMSILGGGYLQTNIMQLTGDEKMSRLGQAIGVEGSYFLTILTQFRTMSISEQYLLMTWSKSNQFLGRSQYKGCPHCGEFSSLGFFTGRANQLEGTTRIQRFRVRHGLSCVIGPVWPVGAGCYSQAALPMPLSKPLYLNTLCEHVRNSSYDRDMIGIETKIRFPEILLLTVFIS